MVFNNFSEYLKLLDLDKTSNFITKEIYLLNNFVNNIIKLLLRLPKNYNFFPMKHFVMFKKAYRDKKVVENKKKCIIYS